MSRCEHKMEGFRRDFFLKFFSHVISYIQSTCTQFFFDNFLFQGFISSVLILNTNLTITLNSFRGAYEFLFIEIILGYNVTTTFHVSEDDDTIYDDKMKTMDMTREDDIMGWAMTNDDGGCSFIVVVVLYAVAAWQIEMM